MYQYFIGFITVLYYIGYTSVHEKTKAKCFNSLNKNCLTKGWRGIFPAAFGSGQNPSSRCYDQKNKTQLHMFHLDILNQSESEKFIQLCLDAWINKDKARIQLEAEIQTSFLNAQLTNVSFFTLKSSDSSIVGTAQMVERRNDLNGVDLFNISIIPEQRGNNLGKTLMELLFEKARERNKEFAFISTNEKLAKFYESCGMVEFGRIPKARIGLDRIYLFKALK